MSAEITPSTLRPANLASETANTRFVNAMRLKGRDWLGVTAIVAAAVVTTPFLWKKVEHFETGTNYRIPYALGQDYWLYKRRLQQIAPNQIAVIGDSVTWGEYVRPDGTLPRFLNEEAGDAEKARFVNAGLNGMFPLALEGLVRHYGGPLNHRKVILHCNLLWMSSPKADLHTEKEERFNHADLVPQFWPRIPCYKADLNHRSAAVVQQHFTFSQLASHLQIAYFGQKNILSWTLEEDNSSPPHYPNAWKNPLAQITLRVPAEPAIDPERGPKSPRHKPWSATGQASTRFEWVELDRSLQWGAFQRLAALLQSRQNDVLVVLGPFNEHIMAEENRPAYRKVRQSAIDWFAKNGVPYVAPEVLPSGLYADGSHPLTEGYQMLARKLWSEPLFRKWLDEAKR